MIEPKWVSGDFIPQQLADVLVEANIAGLTESDESDDEFDDVLYVQVHVPLYLQIKNQSYFPVFPAVLGNMSISRFFANPD
jgi:hypothetical protein